MATEQAQAIEPEDGLLELTMMNAEASSFSFDDVVLEGLRKGIPPEVLTRLKDLWEKTKVILITSKPQPC